MVVGVIGVCNDTVTKNVVVRCSKGTVRGPMRLRLGQTQGLPQAQGPPQGLTMQLPEVGDLSAEDCRPLQHEHP